MADLNLGDALTESTPQVDSESLVQRDFVATLEAESFVDQIGETVGKTDYVPLLDPDGQQQDGTPGVEHGVQKAPEAKKLEA